MKRSGLKLRQGNLLDYLESSPTESLNRARADAEKSPMMRKSVKRKKSDATAVENSKKMYQPVIDADQSVIGPRLCRLCGFCGDLDDEKDKKIHDIYHMSFVGGDLDIGKRMYTESDVMQRMVGRDLSALPGKEPGDLEVVLVARSKSSSTLIKKTQNLLASVERQLDAIPTAHLTADTDYVLLVVSVVQKKLVACLAVEKVQYQDTVLAGVETLGYVGTEKEAFCGVYLLWVAPPYRRKKLATDLLDKCRGRVQGYHEVCYQFKRLLHNAHLAFSHPTDAGTALFTKYAGECDFRIYTSSRNPPRISS